MNTLKILCLENDPTMQLLVSKIFSEYLDLRLVGSITEAIGLLDQLSFNVILVDLHLNGESGFDFLEMLKNREFAFIPSIIVISSSDDEEDEVRSHQANVLEYIRKPIRPKAFRSQIEKHLNRFISSSSSRKVGPLLINEMQMQVRLDDGPLLLTLKEYRLLMKFINNPDRIVSREEILQDVWNFSTEMQSRTIDMHISSLRKKIGIAGEAISSVRGVGYVFSLSNIKS